MAKVQDAEQAKYLVAAEYSEYEHSIALFISEDAARVAFEKHKENRTEVYLCKIMEAGQ